jgi:preprotein translocase SecE subunit
VSYRKNEGRYARMFAFWALLLLIAYGCFHGGGLSDELARLLGDANTRFIDPFPILKTLDLATAIAIGVLVVAGLMLHAVLNRPRVANALIDTEGELKKVTWPTWSEAWEGTLAVGAMVLVLFVFLALVDLSLAKVMFMLMGGGPA